MKIIYLLSVLTFLTQISFAQIIEDVGAGVIDFLLRNPTTANRMNTSEAVALDIIGDLLTTSSVRKHELKYATAGSNKIVINNNDNRNAELVKDVHGRVYLLVDGTIYPISEELVQQATISNYSINAGNSITLLEPYNLSILRTSYVSHKGRYMINSIFAYKWCKDLNGDRRLEFDEFKGVKRVRDLEDFYIAVILHIDCRSSFNVDGGLKLLLEVLDNRTGDLIVRDSQIVKERGTQAFMFPFTSSNMGMIEFPAILLLQVKLIYMRKNMVLDSMIEKIQIIEGY